MVADKVKLFLSKCLEVTLWCIIGMASLIPRFLFDWIGILLTQLIKVMVPKEFKKIATNAEKILEIPSASQASKDFQKKVIKHQIAANLESFSCVLRPHRLRFDGIDELKAKLNGSLSKKKGLLIVTGHLGNWELVAYACSIAANEKFYALAKPSKLKAATKVLTQLRKRLNTIVLWTDSKSLLRDMLKVVRSGFQLGFVMDQKPFSRKGVAVNFMGRDTQFVTGPGKTSIRTGAPIMSVFCMREGPLHYKIICKELVEADHEENDLTIVTQKMASEIERVIRLYPEQWVWNYRRWKF